MSAELSSGEVKTLAGGIVSVVLAIVGGVFKLLRLQSQIARLRGRVAELEEQAKGQESDSAALDERIRSAVRDEVQRAIEAMPSPVQERRTTGSMPSTDALERIVDEKVQAHITRADGEQNAKIAGIAERVADVKRLVEIVVEASTRGGLR